MLRPSVLQNSDLNTASSTASDVCKCPLFRSQLDDTSLICLESSGLVGKSRTKESFLFSGPKVEAARPHSTHLY